MKRKFLVMGLAVAMVLSLSACGKKDVATDIIQTGEATVDDVVKEERKPTFTFESVKDIEKILRVEKL